MRPKKFLPPDLTLWHFSVMNFVGYEYLKPRKVVLEQVQEEEPQDEDEDDVSD